MESQETKLPKVTQISKYNVEYSFTAGGQGQVYLCSYDKKLYAVKIPLRTKNYTSDKFIKENIFIKNLQDQNIIKLIEFQNSVSVVLQNKQKIQCPMTVLQFAQQGDLFDYSMKKHYPQDVCRAIMGQVINGMIYLHYKKKIMHLDLKTQNILVTKDFTFKITDFGHAKTYAQIENLTHQFSYGTEWWVPPEYGDFNQFSGQKVDVFNCGLILCKLATSTYPCRKTPFIRNDELYCLLKRSRYESFWHYFKKKIPHIQLSKNLQRLLLCMLEPDPKKRYTFQQVIDDQWFINTPIASPQKVTNQFLKQKNTLLHDTHTKQSRQKLEQIKRFYEKLNNEEQEQNNNENFRGKSVDSLYRQYKQLKAQRNFQKITQRNKYGISFCSYKPEFIIIYLRNELSQLKDKKQILFDNSFDIYTPIQYRVQMLQPKKEGIFKVKCIYRCPSFQSDIQIVETEQQQGLQNGKNGKNGKNRKLSQQELYQQIKVQVYGQIIRNGQKYGVDWELPQINKKDCWSKQTIYRIKSILKILQDKLQKPQKTG